MSCKDTYFYRENPHFLAFLYIFYHLGNCEYDNNTPKNH